MEACGKIEPEHLTIKTLTTFTISTTEDKRTSTITFNDTLTSKIVATVDYTEGFEFDN